MSGLILDTTPRGRDARSPIPRVPNHWAATKFGYHFIESDERNGDNPPGPLLSISEYRGIELNTRTDGQKASLDVSGYRVVRPNQLAANMMWLNHGGIGVSSLTGYISPDYKVFWISEHYTPRYVHHLFRSSRYVGYFAAVATGVRPNAQRVTKTVLDATPLPLPPFTEQVRIADYLDRETGHIDALLSKMDELTFSLISRLAGLKASVLADIPDRRALRWMVSQISTGPFGTQVKQGDYVSDGVPLINPSHIAGGSLAPDSKTTVSATKATELERFALSVGDVVVARRGEFGRSAVVRAADTPAICGTGSLRVRPDSAVALPEFVQLVISSPEAVRELEQLSVGATMGNLNERLLGEVSVPVISVPEQRAVLNSIDEATRQIEAMLSKVAELKSLLLERRSALITDVITGRKEVA